MTTLVDLLTERILARQEEVKTALTTAALNKVEKLQGQYEGLEEAKRFILDAVADKGQEDDDGL